MIRLRQESLLGEPHDVAEVRTAASPTGVTWLSEDVVREQGAVRALRLLGCDVPDGATPSQRLIAWRDEMMDRTGMHEAEFRRWLDIEVNVAGNHDLAQFIWAIA